MSDERIELDRAGLLAKLDRGDSLTAADLERLAEIAAHDLAQPQPPILAALRVILDEAAAATDRDPPPGLSIRDLSADTLEVITADGTLYTVIPRSTLTDLAARIEAERRRAN